ncbi:MAG: hypothetical protein QOI59_5391 [Gammaproteobacteria bacterium]|nr:hypothetical protein [Gammaproteobacteria bacterium]
MSISSISPTTLPSASPPSAKQASSVPVTKHSTPASGTKPDSDGDADGTRRSRISVKA